MAQPLMPKPLMPELPTAELDASPSRERLGRVVELLRGVEGDPGAGRPGPRPAPRPAPRRRPRAVAVRPMPVSWAEAGQEEPVG